MSDGHPYSDSPDDRRAAQPTDSVGIQLTRMEGKLDRVGDRVSDLRHRVDAHDVEIGGLKSLTQSLSEGATAAEKTAIALAVALRDAKETAETASRSEVAKTAAASQEAAARAALGWSPVTRVFAVIALVAIVFNLYQTLTGSDVIGVPVPGASTALPWLDEATARTIGE